MHRWANLPFGVQTVTECSEVCSVQFNMLRSEVDESANSLKKQCPVLFL